MQDHHDDSVERLGTASQLLNLAVACGGVTAEAANVVLRQMLQSIDVLTADASGEPTTPSEVVDRLIGYGLGTQDYYDDFLMNSPVKDPAVLAPALLAHVALMMLRKSLSAINDGTLPAPTDEEALAKASGVIGHLTAAGAEEQKKSN